MIEYNRFRRNYLRVVSYGDSYLVERGWENFAMHPSLYSLLFVVIVVCIIIIIICKSPSSVP